MVTSKLNQINFQRAAPIIAISFAIGFGAATGAYFLVFCEDCFAPPVINLSELSPEEKCSDDPRCLIDSIIDDDPEISSTGIYKIALITEIIKEPIIQRALIESNEEFSEMSPLVRERIMAQREKEWTSAPELTPFMFSIINNDISNFLSGNLMIPSEEFGDIVFGEFILTNHYGANVAITVRTDNYDQSNDDWWLEVIEKEELVRQCDFDESAQMYSEDIILKIIDNNGEFIGIVNAATPCDVILK